MQFACYGKGSYYRRHSDAQNASRRVLTAIYYVDTGWTPEAGGQLVIRLPAGGNATIAPQADRLLLFRSSLEHEVREVQPGHPPRCAVTQWLQDLFVP